MFSNVLFIDWTKLIMSKIIKLKAEKTIDFLGIPLIKLENGTMCIKFSKPVKIR